MSEGHRTQIAEAAVKSHSVRHFVSHKEVSCSKMVGQCSKILSKEACLPSKLHTDSSANMTDLKAA